MNEQAIAIAQRVLAGAAFLDKEFKSEHGDTWFQALDLERLDIKDGYNCVIGQLFGGFFRFYAMRETEGWDGEGVSPRTIHAIEHGFYAQEDYENDEDGFEREIAALNQAWTSIVFVLRDQAIRA